MPFLGPGTSRFLPAPPKPFQSGSRLSSPILCMPSQISYIPSKKLVGRHRVRLADDHEGLRHERQAVVGIGSGVRRIAMMPVPARRSTKEVTVAVKARAEKGPAGRRVAAG